MNLFANQQLFCHEKSTCLYYSSTYNEKIEVLRSTLIELITSFPNYHILVIDDGSTDDVRPLIADLKITVFRHKINLGKRGCTSNSAELFAKKDKSLITLHFDADGQHDINSLLNLIEPILQDKTDVVLGSRFMEGSNVIKIPRLRKKVRKLGRFINVLLNGLYMTDAHNGLRALNYEALDKILLTQNRFASTTEFVSLIRQHKLRYCEVPVSIKYTQYSLEKGQKSVGAIDIIFDLLIKIIQLHITFY